MILLALAAYSNSFTGSFVFDDIQHVRDNVRLRDLSALLSGEGYAALRHRFVGYLTFALNYRLGKLSVVDYHVVNFFIHAVNAGLVYALVLLTFRTPLIRLSRLAPAAQSVAFFAAALFATHPLQTQAVTYVVQRFSSLATLFYLASIVLYLRWRVDADAAGSGRAPRALVYAGVLACAVLGMKTKEITFTLPFAVLLCEAAFFPPAPVRRKLFLLPILATVLVIPLSVISQAATIRPAQLAEATRVQTTISRLDYLLTQASVVLKYLRMLVWPTGQNLDHDIPVARALLEGRVLGSLAGIGAVLSVAAFLYRRTAGNGGTSRVDPALRLVGFGVLWFFLTLAVESSVIPIVDVMYEHRVYLPSVGIFTGAAILVGLASQRFGPRVAARTTVGIALVLSTVLGFATFRRNRVWANEITLWTDAAEKSPSKSRPHLNLGSALVFAGRTEESLPSLQRAVELEPDSAYARAQLGAALFSLGRLAEAEPDLRAAVGLAPKDPEALFNLAVVLLRTGRAEEAKPLLMRFLEVAPPTYDAARRLAERALR